MFVPFDEFGAARAKKQQTAIPAPFRAFAHASVFARHLPWCRRVHICDGGGSGSFFVHVKVAILRCHFVRARTI